MERPRVVSRAEWLAARKELLTLEKAATRERDALAAARRALPMVPVEKTYVFDSPGGPVSLRALFADRSQLIERRDLPTGAVVRVLDADEARHR